MAVEAVTGATPAWFVEFDKAPSKILAHHWPDVTNYGDVTAVDWATMPPVDILTGGYPCQPFSQAGRRKGTNDERHLWPYVRDAIRLLRPRLVVLENVAGHRSLGFDRVLGDMAEDGLHVRWTSLRASDVGAPHHRERLFILAVSADPEGARLSGQQQSSRVGKAVACTNSSFGAFPDADGERRDGWGAAPEQEGRTHTPTDRHSVGIDFGPYAPAVRRWERLTRPAPAPTELNRNNKPRLSAPFAEWMMGLPAGHVTRVPGISRADQLKAIGNGVCPQQAAAALATLLEMEDI